MLKKLRGSCGTKLRGVAHRGHHILPADGSKPLMVGRKGKK